MYIAVIDNEELAKPLLCLLQTIDGVGKTKCFPNVSEAVASFESARPSAVFLNIDMPGEDALALSRQIMEEAGVRNIVFLSRKGDMAVKAFDAGILDYLQAPVSHERLNLCVHRIIMNSGVSFLSPAQNGLHVKILGDFSVLAEDAVIHWPTAKSAELFLYLLLNDNKNGINKWRIISDLWAEKDERCADTNFRATLYRLNRCLKERGAGECVKTMRGAYRLSCKYVDVDAFRLAEFSRCGGSFSKADIPVLEDLLFSFNGSVMGGNDYSWAYPLGENYRFLFSQISKKLCRQYMEREDFIKADAVISNYLRADSLDEEAHELKLQIIDRTGRHLEAHRYLDFMSAMLKNELGIEPALNFPKSLK